MTAAFDPYSPAVIADPYPALACLRAEDPVHWSDSLGGWLLTRYDDVKGAQTDRRYSAERVRPFTEHMAATDRPEEERMGRLLDRWLLFRDPPAHTPLRRLMVDAFTPRAIAALRPRVGAIVDELLGPLADRDRFDLIADFAYPLPATVIAHILGVPTADLDRFRAWSDDLATVIGNSRLTEDRFRRGSRALGALTEYFQGIVSGRRARAADSALVDHLIAARDAGGPMDEDELVANCVLILFAGHETTTNLIGNAMVLLLRHPDQLAALRAVPGLIPSAVEEVLRYESPAHAIVRVAGEDIELGGKRIRRGDRVFLMLGAANRDPALFDDPDRFDITRAPNRHLSFGYGIHFCIGAELARVEGEIALGRLLARFADADFADERLDWDDSLVLRGLRTLPLRVRPEAA